MAIAHAYLCPNCGARLASDRKRRGYVRHRQRPRDEGATTTANGYCALDLRGKDEPAFSTRTALVGVGDN